jgi:dTDP-4-dehydrorhamnose reductase
VISGATAGYERGSRPRRRAVPAGSPVAGATSHALTGSLAGLTGRSSGTRASPLDAPGPHRMAAYCVGAGGPGGRAALIVGAGGQVGAVLLRQLGERAVGTWRTPAAGRLTLDLEDMAARPALAADVVRRADVRTVFVVAAMTQVDRCEDHPATAMAVNRDAPARLAAAARRRGARTVFFSTEYVFDGTTGPYRESDEARPLSVYGRTKLAGEQAVLEADPAALVVRTTVVWGPEANGRNFAHQLARRLRDGTPMAVPEDQISTPTYNDDLARATVALVDAGVTGVVHVAGAELLDRAAFARRLAAAMGLDPALVQPVPTAALGQRAARPLRAGLRIDRLRSLLPSFEPLDPEAAVALWARDGPQPWRDRPEGLV